jgi:hypothetical protein
MRAADIFIKGFFLPGGTSAGSAEGWGQKENPGLRGQGGVFEVWLV